MKATVYYTDNGKGKRKIYTLVKSIEAYYYGTWIRYVDLISDGSIIVEQLPDTTEKIMLSDD